MSIIRFGRVAAFCAMLAASPALAHATLEQQTASSSSTYKGVMRIGHGCAGEATHTVSIQIPEGVVAAKPMPKAGWSVSTVQGPYARTYDLYGKPVSAGVKEIVWSGGHLAPDHYDEFVFQARLTADLTGEVFFPTVQHCATKAERWVEIPASGQDPHALKGPAPRLRIVQAQHAQGHGAAGHGAPAAQAGSVKLGALTITAPWTRATPGGAKVAGGFMTITNTGTTPDRLIGGTFPLAGRFEVHEMAVTDGVMRMRELTRGLEIRPGETVELKPGGYHVMFMELKEPVREGQPVTGTLVFEKAGTVTISYRVAPIGARAPGAHQH